MNPQLSTYRYDHSGPRYRSRSRWVTIGVLLLLGLGVFVLAPALFPLGMVIWGVALMVYGTAPKFLRLGPRYLLCGKQIVYHANVKRITFAKSEGRLQLHGMNGEHFVLERDKFPTDARREPKISQKKAAKFETLSSKIIFNIQRAQPYVERIDR
jgi:hypothetical protein